MRIDMTTPDAPLRIVVKSSSRARAQRIVSAIAERHRQRQQTRDPLGLGELMRRYGEPQHTGAWNDAMQSMQSLSA